MIDFDMAANAGLAVFLGAVGGLTSALAISIYRKARGR